MKIKAEYLGLLFVFIGSLVAIRYLFIPGFLPTHDGEYHLIRFYEFSRMLTAGNFFPRWAPGLNSGYGVPLFNFFYPLPNYIGSLFHFLGWSLADSFRLTMAVGYMLAIIASYYWLKRLYGVFPAVIGSIIGAFTPYWFVDIFVRGSVGEVLALGFVFMVLASIAYKKKTLLALSVAAIILSHNIMAMIFLPVFFLYAWITDKSMLRWVIVGIILTLYFWAPALMERGYVTGLNTVNYKDHFPELAQLLIPSWGTGFSGPGYALDEMSYQIGIVPMTVAMVALGLLLIRKSSRRTTGFSVQKDEIPGQARNDKAALLLFLIILGISFILMLEISLPVWERIPLLTNLQYPWRLLSEVVVATPFLTVTLFYRLRWRPVFIGVAIVTVVLSFSYTKPVLYVPRPDEYYLSKREFTDGTSSLGNGFSTRWMSWQPQRPAKRIEVASGTGSVRIQKEGLTMVEGNVDTEHGVVVRANIAYYPGWRVVVDGRDESAISDEKGMISTTLGPGMHTITVYFSETPLRFTADIVSLLSLFWLFYSTILKKRYEYSN
ncbi:hypothetical protein HY949_01655 [Candidatus Gottesmanbacteria bacterium]|nr:hypothetical protein [Candidatus Gottesmanbacteria bacterium]